MAESVVIAMSGGVDSSVAALLLKEKGYNCIGVSMQVWNYKNNGGSCTKATCCSPDDFTDARKVAAAAGIPYYVFDFEKLFREEVIDPFVTTYKRGATPNPCVECNNKVKFRALRDRARHFGFPNVATGHYAQIVERDGALRLERGADIEKDQSYFLYGLRKEELTNTMFPVGHLCKEEVREIAAKHGLSVAHKAESQDICFVSGSLQDFLVRIGGKMSTGKIVTRSGNVIGTHEGISNFTVGQRKGINIGGHSEPLYVLELDDRNNLVVVGQRHELETEGFSVGNINWITPPEAVLSDGYVGQFSAIAQVRYRHKGIPVDVIVSDGRVSVRFKKEWATVSPGQAVVFYCLNNREVLGGGTIGSSAAIPHDYEKLASCG